MTETKTRAPRPQYGLEPVDALPENPKRTGISGGPPRRDVYGEALPEVAANPGVWYQIGVFYTRGGAQGAAKGLQERLGAGKIENLPAGEFDIESRRTEVVTTLDPEAPKGSEIVGPITGEDGKTLADVGTSVSRLYVKFLTPDMIAAEGNGSAG